MTYSRNHNNSTSETNSILFKRIFTPKALVIDMNIYVHIKWIYNGYAYKYATKSYKFLYEIKSSIL